MSNAGDRRLLCTICDTLPPGELIELDRILGDPLTWPVTVWRGFDPPEGGMPPSYRRFGAQNMGEAWLKANGYDISRGILRGHIRYDVPIQAVDVDQLIQKGLVALATPGSSARVEGVADPIDPLAYISLYNKGIQIGIAGIDELSRRAKAHIDKQEEVPLALVKMMVDAGLKLAQSQAGIKAAGKPFGDEDPNEDDAFRGGDDISKRFAGNRIRTVDGVSRPVADEGPADRAHYNERAAQEGGDPIGGR